MNQRIVIVASGLVIGILGVLLVYAGNPSNMGICVACFIRDIAGGLGLHQTEIVQYIRPEILGFILGAFIIAALKKEFKPLGGSSPLIRFVLGAFVMIGALVFLGCPLRMVLRLAAGDLTAIWALLGFVGGVYLGTNFLKMGFTLGRNYNQGKSEGQLISFISIGLLVLLVAVPSVLFFSESGPGSLKAPLLISLGAGLLIGILAQRSRICLAGGIRDLFLIKDPHLIYGFISIFVFALVLNIIFGYFNLGFQDQPVAHNDALWSFLGMGLAGLGSVMLGGCPLRQTIMAGEGNTDSAIAFFGMFVGAAISHNLGLAGSPAGVGTNGKVAVIVGFLLMFGLAYAIISQTRRGGASSGK